MAPKKFGLSLMLVMLSSQFVPVIADTDTTDFGTDSGTDTGAGSTGTGSATGPGSTTGIFTTTTVTVVLPTLPTQLPPGGTTVSSTSSTSSSSTSTSSSTSSPSGTGKPGPTSTSSTQSPSGTGPVVPTATQTSSSSSSTSTRSPPTTSSTLSSVLVVTAYATVTKTKWSTTSANCGTPSPFPPALPLGCYNEGPNGRALPDFFFEDDVLMTIDKCVGLCPNYTFLGLEYGTQCWCSNSIQNGAFPVDNGQCDTVCAGNAQQICGSDDTLSVYLPPPPPPPRPANNITYSAAGCYAEPGDGSRALNKSRIAAPDMTPDSCFNICGTSGYLYAGLEYGDECWCGNQVSSAATLVDPSRCNINCTGDATRTCGGREVLNLYNGTYTPSAVARLPVPHAPIWDKLLNGKCLAAGTHETTNTTIEQDYLTVSDIFGTGWASLDFSGFETGDTVAVFGAGPVGLMAAYLATLRGASRVYVVDHVQSRLDRAASIGAITINFASGDPVAQIMASEPNGVMRPVDCIGIEALNSTLHHEPNIILNQMVNITHVGGGIGQVGVYAAQPDTPGSPLGSTFSPIAAFPLSEFIGKRLRFQAGPVDAKACVPMLVELISSGKASPHFVASSSISIEDVPAYYARFNDHEEIKVFIRFP